MKKDTVVFLGNGLNLAEGIAPYWSELLSGMVDDKQASYINQLPNTLGYELAEMHIYQNGVYKTSKEIKKSIVKRIREKIPHGKKNKMYDWRRTLHYECMSLPINTYMTTNYDYALEYSLCNEFKAGYNTRERLYSFRRWQGVADKKVYHIHGEVDHLDSICLGFEHYAGSLEKMRGELVRTIPREQGESSFYLNEVLEGREIPEDKWFYHFFTSDIYFVGFGFDTSEMDIWWLLSYRKHAILEGKIKCANQLYYFDTESASTRRSEQYCAKIELLKSYDVNVVQCEGRTYKTRYKDALEKIRDAKNAQKCRE